MKIRPEVFLKAAEMIASEKDSCCCPALVNAGARWEEREFFGDLFKRDSEGYKQYNVIWWWFGKPYSTEARIIALLLAYEIAKGGGL